MNSLAKLESSCNWLVIGSFHLSRITESTQGPNLENQDVYLSNKGSNESDLWRKVSYQLLKLENKVKNWERNQTDK
jgi:hypothetical protein